MGEKTQSVTDAAIPRHASASGAILIVEDEKLVAWDLEQTLREHDYDHITVTSSVRGARSHMQLTDINISLVILDLKLADGDGTVLIEEFLLMGIAVLVMTGYSGFQHPGAPVLYKPFKTIQLLDAVQLLMGQRC
jgi:DNA-binding NtrC family response regulator